MASGATLPRLLYPTALAVSLSLWLMAVRAPLWLDETLCYWQISGGFGKIWSRAAAMPSSAAYLYILWLAKSSLGSTEIALRTPSLLAMLAATYFLFRAARELFSREIAYLAAILFCLQENVVFAAIDARPYAFALLATTLAMFALIRWVSRNSMGYAVLFGASAAAILHFHYLFGSVLPAFAAYYILNRRRSLKSDAPQLAATLLTFAVIFLPLASRFLSLFRNRQTHTFAGDPQTFVLLRAIVPFKMLVVFLVVLFLAALIRKVKLPASDAFPAALIGPLTALVPIAILYGLSAATPTRVFLPRYCLSAVPGAALTWAWLVGWIDSSRLKQIFCAGLVAFTVFVAFTSPDSRRHELSYKSAFEAVNTNIARDQATVLLCSGFIESDYERLPPVSEDALWSQTSYYRIQAPAVLLPMDLNAETIRVAGESVDEAARKQQRFFVVAGPVSYSTIDWIGNYSRGSFAPRLLGTFDEIAVVEFSPVGD